MALFAGNVELSDITENLVFSDPYFAARLNKHTPGLEPWIARLRADRDMKVAAQEMKHAFVSKAETLVHGDLHSGSIMVTAEDTQVIDPEFAVYGPFGFDVGMLLANVLLGLLRAVRPRTRARRARSLSRLAPLRRSATSGRRSRPNSATSGAPSAPASSTNARSSRIRATSWPPNRRCPRSCAASGPTRWASRGWRCTAASSASPMSRISRRSPIPPAAIVAERRALALGRQLAVLRTTLRDSAAGLRPRRTHRKGDLS